MLKNLRLVKECAQQWIFARALARVGNSNYPNPDNPDLMVVTRTRYSEPNTRVFRVSKLHEKLAFLCEFVHQNIFFCPWELKIADFGNFFLEKHLKFVCFGHFFNNKKAYNFANFGHIFRALPKQPKKCSFSMQFQNPDNPDTRTRKSLPDPITRPSQNPGNWQPYKKGHFWGKKRGGQFGKTLGQFLANLCKKMAIFSATYSSFLTSLDI